MSLSHKKFKNKNFKIKFINVTKAECPLRSERLVLGFPGCRWESPGYVPKDAFFPLLLKSQNLSLAPVSLGFQNTYSSFQIPKHFIPPESDPSHSRNQGPFSEAPRRRTIQPQGMDTVLSIMLFFFKHVASKVWYHLRDTSLQLLDWTSREPDACRCWISSLWIWEALNKYMYMN